MGFFFKFLDFVLLVAKLAKKLGSLRIESQKSSLSLSESPKNGSSVRLFESEPKLVTSTLSGRDFGLQSAGWKNRPESVTT